MEKKYDYYDYLRYEMFEVLIPRMLYKGTKKENNKFFEQLLRENNALIYDIYRTMCEDDGVPCPYQKEDFGKKIFSRGKINILQISLPADKPGSAVLRAYLFFAKYGRKMIKKYFVIKRFDDGSIFNFHITPDIEGVLGEELTAHAGDMEYECQVLVKDYVRTVIQDMRAEDGQGRHGIRDLIRGKRKGEQHDMEITAEQFEEFLRRLQGSESEAQ